MKMKRFLAAVMVMAMVFSGMVGAIALAETESEAILVGGWSEPESPVVTDEAKAALEKATESLVGAEYTPVALLGTQLVAGTNYAILCKVTAVVPEAEPEFMLVVVYQDLNGNAEITDIYSFTKVK